MVGTHISSSRDRALSIIELLVRHVRGLSMSEIADTLGIPRTAAHRLLVDLKAMGYVKQDPSTSHYLLTIRLASQGLSYLAASGITDVAQPLLEELAAATGELARLAIAEGDQLTWVAKAQGARTGLRYDPDAGADVYLPATANGLAFLAALKDEHALRLIAAQGMDKISAMGPGAPRTLRELTDRIYETRARGYAVVFDAYEAGTSAIAAVIRRKADEDPIGTVSIAGPSIRICRERIETLVPYVLDCAERLAAVSGTSMVFGGR
jgi:IclR family acetate operon transcriptional repressor